MCISVAWKLFKGAFYYCQGPDVRDIKNKSDCINKPNPPYKWIRHKYNFDDLGQVSCSSFSLGIMFNVSVLLLRTLVFVESVAAYCVVANYRNAASWPV